LGHFAAQGHGTASVLARNSTIRMRLLGAIVFIF
jgi:hypothetical protein